MTAAANIYMHDRKCFVEPEDLTHRLRPLLATVAFPDSIRLLTNLARSDNLATAHHQLERVLANLTLLPHSLRRLAWLHTFASPELVRLISHRVAVHHWEIGVGRRWNLMETAGGASHLLGIVARSPAAGHAGLLLRLGESEAFTALLPRNESNLIAAEAANLSSTCTAVDCFSMYEATKPDKQPSVRETCHLAAWLRALLTPGSGNVPPTESDACILLCTAPLFRGLRRRGARAHGRAIGIALRNVTTSQPSSESRVVPMPLTGGDRTSPLLAPLVVDFLIAAMSELEPTPDPRRRIKKILLRAPELVGAVRNAVGSAELMTTDRWLDSVMGVAEAENTYARIDEGQAV